MPVLTAPNMRSFVSHFNATPKSLGAFALAAVAMLTAFKVLTTEQAEAVGGVVTLFLAMLVPARKDAQTDEPAATE